MKIDRQAVHDKYDGHCAYCGKKLEYKQMQVDHIVPRDMKDFVSKLEKVSEKEYLKYYANSEYKYARKGLDNIMNLNPSCRRCNHYKRASTLERFRRSIKTLNERLQKFYIFKVALDFGIVEVRNWTGTFYFEFGHEREDNK